MKWIGLGFIWVSLACQFSLAVSEKECFPFERLEPRLETLAKEILLRALDREALFTIVGDLKSWSTFGHGFKFSADLSTDFKERIEDLRVISSVFHCGDNLEMGFHHYRKQDAGYQYGELYVLKKSSANQLIKGHRKFFSSIGVQPENLELPEVLDHVESSERYDRFRAYGLLFGYPLDSVNFFIRAARYEDETGIFLERKFVHVPTYDAATGRFTWAVPVDYTESIEEAKIRRTAHLILDRYRKLRVQWLGNSESGGESASVLKLVRDWFCVRPSDCDPRNAAF